jgi:hypothetical protein
MEDIGFGNNFGKSELEKRNSNLNSKYLKESIEINMIKYGEGSFEYERLAKLYDDYERISDLKRNSKSFSQLNYFFWNKLGEIVF